MSCRQDARKAGRAVRFKNWFFGAAVVFNGAYCVRLLIADRMVYHPR